MPAAESAGPLLARAELLAAIEGCFDIGFGEAIVEQVAEFFRVGLVPGTAPSGPHDAHRGDPRYTGQTNPSPCSHWARLVPDECDNDPH